MATELTPREQIEEYKKKYGFTEPNRGNLDDPSIVWRFGKPNYDIANLQYFKGKSQNHAKDSLEKLVEDLVKTWEMEMSHKQELKQFTTVEMDFSLSANGGEPSKGEKAMETGNYVSLMKDTRKELFNYEEHDFDSSHKLFRGTFKNGFPWEVITVFSGPPKVVFSWRHWGTFDGEYKNRAGDNQIYEMYGICEALVNEDLKVKSLEIFYKPDEWLEALEFGNSEDNRKGQCPILGKGNAIAEK